MSSCIKPLHRIPAQRLVIKRELCWINWFEINVCKLIDQHKNIERFVIINSEIMCWRLNAHVRVYSVSSSPICYIFKSTIIRRGLLVYRLFIKHNRWLEQLVNLKNNRHKTPLSSKGGIAREPTHIDIHVNSHHTHLTHTHTHTRFCIISHS